MKKEDLAQWGGVDEKFMTKKKYKMSEIAEIINADEFNTHVKIFRLLRDKGILLGSNYPSKKYEDCGLFEIVFTSHYNGDKKINIMIFNVLYEGAIMIKELINSELKSKNKKESI